MQNALHLTSVHRATFYLSGQTQGRQASCPFRVDSSEKDWCRGYVLL